MYLLTREKSITRIHQILMMKLVTPRGGGNGMERMEGWEIESKRWGILKEKKKSTRSREKMQNGIQIEINEPSCISNK